MNPTDAFVPIQTAEQLFHSAEATLLTPNGLDADKLAPVFSRLLTHDVDYADLYFQYSRSEGWSLEEGQVKSGSFNIDQGVGVRAISGEKTAFAYSDDIRLDALAPASEYEVIFIARSDGHLAADVRPLVRLSLQVIAEQDGRREQGSGGGGGRFDHSSFTHEILEVNAAP